MTLTFYCCCAIRSSWLEQRASPSDSEASVCTGKRVTIVAGLLVAGASLCGRYTESPALLKELVQQVATHIGPFARPGMIVGSPGLPKTRSGESAVALYVLLLLYPL